MPNVFGRPKRISDTCHIVDPTQLYLLRPDVRGSGAGGHGQYDDHEETWVVHIWLLGRVNDSR